jgi:hypothetical protein
MASTYPDSLPCPLIDGFGADISAGLIRTPFEGGNTRQRRLHTQLPHIFRMTWIIKQVTDYGTWLNWMNANGWSWFDINLPSAMAGKQGKELAPHTIRLISDLSTELVPTAKGFYWRVSVQAEWMPASFASGGNAPPFSTRSAWYIARSPSNPSTPDWVVARNPVNPSPDNVVAGSPGSPSALV